MPSGNDKPNQYMDLLNIKEEKQVLTEIRNLASELTEHDHLIRSCIFDLHAAVEIELRRIFFWKFQSLLFFTDDKSQNSNIKKKYEKMIDRLSFLDMWRILKPVMIDWYPSFDAIEEINKTRNQAAHGDIEKIRYKNRSPFKSADCLCQIYFDVWAIKQEIPKFFGRIMLPHYRCRAYYEKFGEIGVSKEIIQKVDDWYADN